MTVPNGSLNGTAAKGTEQSSNGHTNGHINGQSNGHSNGSPEAITTTTSPNGTANGNKQPPKPIAICGMACRLPSGIKTPQQLWSFLLAGNDARSKVPSSRYNIESFYDPSGKKPGTTKTEHGYFLDEDLANLDTSFFSMPAKEVARIDPQQRLMLEVARECFEDGGETAWRGKKVGVYVGNLGDDWLEMLATDTQNYGIYRLSGYGDFALSNRVSVTVRTACSASMVALHEACVAIDRGDCVSAIVGGTNLILRPSCTTMMSEQGVLSPDGSCKTFSTDVNGYARGEAIVGVFVKPLEDAIRDGNAIRAVIRATASNHDGKTSGFNLPSSDAQEAMMRRAYEVAGLDVGGTGYVECHGTGTPVGDPIETRAVARVFGEVGGVTIGSTKPNFGHTEGASGILSVLKTVLALENRTIPPSIKCSPRNPSIPWEEGKLALAEQPIAWPNGRLERASVNSFGLGGSNAHAIIDSAVGYKPPAVEPEIGLGLGIEDAPQLLLYTANTEPSLTALMNNYKIFIEQTAPNVKDVAYTLARGREHLPYRAFAIATGSSVGAVSPITKPSQQKPKIAMVFTGQGAQWPRMGADLIKSNSAFRDSIRYLDQYLQDTLGEEAPSWNIEKELQKQGKKSRLSLAEFAQPLCTALQIALVDALRTVGIEADAVVGHSSGEIAGAYASGALTAGEAIVAAYYRGFVANKQERRGAMAALGMGVVEAEQFLVPGTGIACDNSPRSVTISGDAEKIEEVLATIRAARPDTLARKLQADKAYHSYHMAEIGEVYNELIEEKIAAKRPCIPFFSSVENRLLDAETDSTITLGSRYWRKNLESPVLFNGAVTSLLQHFSRQSQHEVILLEVGPHSALAGPLTQIMSETKTPARYIATLIRNQNSIEDFLTTVGKLFTSHLPINLQSLFPTGTSRCLPDLPRYPFNHGTTKHWFESRLSKEFRQREYPHHDLLGARVVESTDLEPAWRNLLHVNYSTVWLKDHKVGQDIVFPFAGYVAMAGEAVRQTTKIEDAFRLRRVSVGTAMLLSEEKPTEIITSLKPLRLTISQDSSWYEFTVSAYNGRQWTKHCSGEVKAESPESLPAGTSPDPFARAVGWERWFDGVRREGLDLDYFFQNVDQITASTTEHEARGIVSSRKHPFDPRSQYHMHPAVLDSALQLLSVACSKGLTRKHKNFLPIFVDQLLVARTKDEEDFVMDVRMSDMGNGSTSSRLGEGQGILGGQVVLQFEGLKITPASITDDAVDVIDPHAAARLTWAADIDFVDVQSLFQASVSRQEVARDLEELGKLCLGTSSADESTSQRIQQYRERLSNTSASSVTDALIAATSNNDSLLVNTTSPETLPTIDNFLSDLELDSSAFFKTLGHSNPTLRVLEMSHWATSPSIPVLNALTLPSGRHLWSQYTFASRTAIASGERLTGYLNLEYAALDISGDLASQGFEGRQYDLVIANNAVHASSSIAQSLLNIRKLLAVDSRLLLQELTPAHRDWVDLVLGTVPGEPYLDASRWKEELGSAGFDTAFVGSDTDAHQIHTLAIARPRPSTVRVETIERKPISLLVRDPTKTYDLIETALQNQGYKITKITLKHTPRPNIDIISILDLDGPFFTDIADEPYYDFQKFLANLKNSGIIWVTGPCHIRVQDPRYAQVIGLARVIRSELLIDFATCEVDDLTQPSINFVAKVLDKFSARGEQNTTTAAAALSPDFEYAIHNGVVHIGRYFPFVMMDDFKSKPNIPAQLVENQLENQRMKVVIGTPGRLNTLHWEANPNSTATPPPLKDHEVEIEMHAVGVNFKDVLVGMNLIDHVGRYHGLEGAGIVRRVGAKVTEFKAGDRVAAMEHNMLSTLLIANEIMCVRIPDELSFIDAATMFTVYATVQQALITVGRLQRGESLLVHSACGGVGLAAIQIGRMIGAQIYATVGSEEKVRYLEVHCGIPRNRIFNSRDNSFVQGVFRETNGRGVDMVLNSLSGELLHETWKCVAPHGKMIEIGKRELIGHGRLDMQPFVANRSYCCVDIDAFYDTSMSRFKEMMTETLEYLQKGHITPIPIAKEFDASSVAEAFKYLLPGTHIGRVGIRIRDINGQPTLHPGDKNAITTPLQTLQLDPQASYLLVGGLGGLGRAISRYMVEHGARHLVYLSRSAGQTPNDQEFIAEIKSMAVAPEEITITTVQGDITSLSSVCAAISHIPTTTHPLKGILQLTAVQADENFARLPKSQWDYSLAPKVTGTWNLHYASAAAKLDFFLLFSSMSSVIGLPGQANYASGNSFLDAFVQYRNGLNLPCSAVDIGPVADVGFLSEREALLRTATLTGFKTLQEQEMLDSIGLSMMAQIPPPSQDEKWSSFSDPNVFVLGLESTIPLDSPSNRAVWKKDRRMAIYHNSSSPSSSSSSSTTDPSSSPDILKTYLASARADPSLLKSPTSGASSFFATEIGKRLFRLLLKDERDINTGLALSDLGLDSLVAIELRAWWKGAFGFDISVLEMLSLGSLQALGGFVVERLVKGFDEAEGK
ncbi:reducing polyketide synthase sphB [Aspergillus stella-maris]|uniref:reducing polyketide synthase sphB n=1 Tax=Aspergillus stella-maris TaxID=1810926 RepID=UPI003CCD1C68